MWYLKAVVIKKNIKNLKCIKPKISMNYNLSLTSCNSCKKCKEKGPLFNGSYKDKMSNCVEMFHFQDVSSYSHDIV